jgi:hypothetical protein
MIVASLQLSCGQDFNSNSFDYSPGNQSNKKTCSAWGDQSRCEAVDVIQRLCTRCHSEWAKLEENSEWISSGLVIPGDPKKSPIIARLINSGSNMPLNGTALNQYELQALSDWIVSLNNLNGALKR